MRVMGVALGIKVIGATLAASAAPPACVLSADDNGLARMQTSPTLEGHVQTLCEKLAQEVEDRPALARALARRQGRISLHVTARPNRLGAQLVLHAADQDLPGSELTLTQIDGGPSDFDPEILTRLARHLLDAAPFDAFIRKP
jgi:hypothetical protein